MIAAAPPPGVTGTDVDVLVVPVFPVPVPVFPVELVVGEVNGPLVGEVVGVIIVPVVEFTMIGGFKPVTKPPVVLPDWTGPVSPKVPKSPRL